MYVRESLVRDRVRDLEMSAPASVSPDDSIASAIALMQRKRVGCVLVRVGESLRGIFTERDLLRVIGDGRGLESPIADVMTADPKTVTIEDSLLDAIRWMDQGGYRRLPVVDGAGVPVGFVDVKTITHFLVEHFPAGIYNQASHAQLIARSREGA